MGKQERNRKNRRQQPAQKLEAKTSQPRLLKIAAAAMLLFISGLLLLFGIGIWHQATAERDAKTPAIPSADQEPIAPDTGYQPAASAVEFWNARLNQLVANQLLAGQYPLAAVNDYGISLQQAVTERFNSIFSVNLNDRPQDDESLFGFSIKDKPTIVAYIDSLEKYWQKLQASDPAAAQKIFENEVIVRLLENLEFMRLSPGGTLSNDEKVAFLLPAYTSVMKQAIEPMIEAGCRFDENTAGFYAKWLDCGRDEQSAAWRETLTNGWENAKANNSRQWATAKYSDAQMNEYNEKRLKPLLLALNGGKFDIPEISGLILEYKTKILDRYGNELSLIKTNSYFPGTKDCPLFTTVQEGYPAIGISLPAMMDERQRMESAGDSRYDERERNSLATSLIHEMIHLSDGKNYGELASFEDHIAEEKHVWALTLERAIAPLVEKYQVPVDESDGVYYRAWVGTGRIENSPGWDKFIRDLYRKAGR